MASVIGQRVRRLEDPRFLTGKGSYVDDLRLQDALHVAFVRSPWAHARVRGIDTAAAAALDGVRIFTANDLDIGPMPVPPMLQAHESMRRPLLAAEVVRFAGEAVAVVLAPTRERAVDAAELVEVDYEPLPAVTDAAQALRARCSYSSRRARTCVCACPPSSP